MNAPIVKGSRMYRDSELENLTRECPVHQTLGLLYPLLRMDFVIAPNYGGLVFRNSPAQNLWAERFFGDLVRFAALQEEWVGYDTLWTPGKIDYVKRAQEEGKELSPEAIGVSKAVDNHLIRLIIEQGKVYAAPTKKLVKFVSRRIKTFTSDGHIPD